MRRFLTTLMAVMLLSCFIAATAEAYDITGDWTMDYFGIPMVWSFHPEGNFEGIIDMDIPRYVTGTVLLTSFHAF